MTNLPSWLRAAIITALQTFIASAGLAMLSLFDDIQEWVTDGPVPDFKSAARLILAAMISAIAGVVAAVHRKLSPPEVTYPDPPPGG